MVNARGNNLRGVTVDVPVGLFTCVTGVSGSGKSTLIQDVLYPALARHLGKPTETPGAFDQLLGADWLTDAVFVDQSPIGKTARSNPVSYVGAWDAIRSLFADAPLSRQRSYTQAKFSINSGAGRCPTSGGSAAYRRFLAEELKPWIAARYRTSGETALIGESLAGLFVVETFLKQPVLFDAYIAASPSLWWDDQSLARGAAAGVEIDRYDLTLGTPPHARILATSEQFSDNYPLVQEEIMYNHPGMGGTQHPGVRCDMVYFTTPNHGAVFSPSSIAWGQALPCMNFDNNVSRVMKNVLDAFIKPGPLPGSEYIGEEKLWR